MIKLKINGQEKTWDGDPTLPLLWFIRDEIGLTGTKYGCGQAICGACTVLVDKEAARSCITSVSDVADREVTTIEGLHPTGDHPVQKAWRQVNVPQCGFCQAGQIMQAASLLTQNPKPSHDQIREAMLAISAAAAATSASKTPFTSHRRGCDHEYHCERQQIWSFRAIDHGRERNAPRYPQGPRSCRKLRACGSLDVPARFCRL